MSDGEMPKRAAVGFSTLRVATPVRSHEKSLHPAWQTFVRFCGEMRHGEIECLKIQDGLPVLAEIVKKKVKFTE